MAENQPLPLEASPCISRKVGSLINSVGKISLPQYRAQAVLDIAGRVVQAESVDEFLDELLPYSCSGEERCRLPRRPRRNASNNPFRALAKAGNMSEAKVVRLFAAAVKEHNLTPGMGLGRCQHKPDRRKKMRKKEKDGEEVPKVDMMRQKVDAAFFRSKYLPKDGRPHWSDQGVPVEFKGGKRGIAVDPFENQQEDAEELDEEELDDEQVAAEEEELEEEVAEESNEDDCGEESDDEESSTPIASSLEPKATTRKGVRGQITTYNELLQVIQHREAVFMLLILGRRFRILRWDRAGVIVTKSIDYYEDPGPLCDFLWRISHLPDTALGFDPSATRLSSEDPEWSDMNRRAIPLESDVNSAPRVLNPGELQLQVPGREQTYIVFDYVRKQFAQSIADSRWPRFKLRVFVRPTETRDFLVGKPVFSAPGAVGRGTRGYVAVDCETGRFVWLKDSWRAAYEGVEQEGLILQRLDADPQIKDVPTLVCHGDVLAQRTLTAAWWEKQNPLAPSTHRKSSDVPPGASAATVEPRGVKREREDDAEEPSPDAQTNEVSEFCVGCPIRHHQHYRIVVEEVGMPLDRFETGLQLVCLLFDCLKTHHLAATRPSLQILHRDISDGNIIIIPKVAVMRDGRHVLNWTGVLTDWENSKPIDMQPLVRARQPERTGNWQFASVNLLNESKAVKIPDELESILLILIYYAIRYLTSSIHHPDSIATFLDECFDCFALDGGVIKCGQRKAMVMNNGSLAYYVPRDGLVPITFKGSPLDHLISELLKRFAAHYKVTKYDAWHKALHTEEREDTPPPPVVRDGVKLVYDLALLTKHDTFDDDPQAAEYEAEFAHATGVEGAGEPEEPSEEERTLATKVWAHSYMNWIFRRCVTMAGWERVHRVEGDNIPKGWVSSHPPIPHESSPTPTKAAK
ncbi:hypothetical protein LXA43DRAFT_1099549 [Ganoderma leucocontextum]|nr:hypothetical protein LXA43DRAFT_1099549 [Ganoderma leucocontextum]